jgi:hypothetical protein
LITDAAERLSLAEQAIYRTATKAGNVIGRLVEEEKRMERAEITRVGSRQSEEYRRARYWVDCGQLWNHSGVPEERLFAGSDLRRIIAGEEPRLPAGYIELARVLVGLLEAPALLAVVGDRGRGKTHLACGLVKEFCRAKRPAMYRRTKRLFSDLDSAAWSAKENVRRSYVRPELLVLDEIQVRDLNKEWQDNELTDLIDRRYAQQKATLILSNLDAKMLPNHLGSSIHRRLVEGGGIYETNWPRIMELLGEGAGA